MQKILIINGPNINFLGIRQKEIYGNRTYEDLVNMCKEHALKVGVDIEIFQSNHEGSIIDKIQEAYFNKVDGIIINGGGYTHTSIAIMDALKGSAIPTIEVHLSNIYERESYRHISYIKEASIHSILGKGMDGYLEAIDCLKEYLSKK